MSKTHLAPWLHSFFHEWLAEQRNCSRHTVLSYRDTWRMFLRFVAGRRHSERRPRKLLTIRTVANPNFVRINLRLKANCPAVARTVDFHDLCSTMLGSGVRHRPIAPPVPRPRLLPSTSPAAPA